MNNALNELKNTIEETLIMDSNTKSTTSNNYVFQTDNNIIRVRIFRKRYIISKVPLDIDVYHAEVYNKEKEFLKAILIEEKTEDFDQKELRARFLDNTQKSITLNFDQKGNISKIAGEETIGEYQNFHLLSDTKTMTKTLKQQQPYIEAMEEISKRGI